MEENVGEDESEIDSITSSQRSFLKSCPFADPDSPLTKSSGDSVRTEILGNPISPTVVRTPVLSFSTPTSLDSINDEDVFRTPPENASLSSAADSEPRVRVSEMIPPSSKSETTPVSASPSLTNRLSDSVPALSSPTTVVADDVRVPGKHSDLDSPSPIAIERTVVLENQPVSDSVANTGLTKSASPVKNLSLDSSSSPSATETENPGGDKTAIPFKEVIEGLLRNNGEKLDERDDKVSYFEVLKQCGLRFP
ncbi:hypothetical protein EUTSA_v10000603mg [Eutrema salsugineum]|uniref:Uncharacterized protein n=1 Tax=Eutrema salsugineum TaxID=72664 RepID=V4LV78_EUTSA|nr:hypothetical protein EUTSA_v10000603mg [Eutrema salsugineum]